VSHPITSRSLLWLRSTSSAIRATAGQFGSLPLPSGSSAVSTDRFSRICSKRSFSASKRRSGPDGAPSEIGFRRESMSIIAVESLACRGNNTIPAGRGSPNPDAGGTFIRALADLAGQGHRPRVISDTSTTPRWRPGHTRPGSRRAMARSDTGRSGRAWAGTRGFGAGLRGRRLGFGRGGSRRGLDFAPATAWLRLAALGRALRHCAFRTPSDRSAAPRSSRPRSRDLHGACSRDRARVFEMMRGAAPGFSSTSSGPAALAGEERHQAVLLAQAL